MPLEISRPEIIRGTNGRVRLIATVTFPNEKKELYFETKEEWAEHFVTDRMDAFVLILLPYAMKTGQNIVCHGPLSREFFEKISDSLIPLFSQFTDRYNNIQIYAETTNAQIESKALCATGFSGGVDSMYTVYTLKDRIENFNILATFDAGVYEHKGHLNELYEAERTTGEFAEKIGMSVIGLSCNITDLVDEHYRSVVCFRIFACALALGKAWSRYIFSPERIAVQKEIHEDVSESALPILLYSCSTNYLKFEQYGAYSDREAKIKTLSEAPAIYRDNIHVCIRDYVFGHRNCCYCTKCARFLTMVDMNGMLDSFSAAFPVDEYRKNKIRINVSKGWLRKNIESEMYASSEEEAAVVEKSEKQMDAIKLVINKNKDRLALKVKENDLV